MTKNFTDTSLTFFRTLVPFAFIFSMFANIRIFSGPHSQVSANVLVLCIASSLALLVGTCYCIYLNHMESKLRNPNERINDAI